MKHFDLNAWADLTRGTAPEPERAAMEAHLSTGCARCESAFAFVGRVVGLAHTLPREEPSADAVRWAKAVMAMHRPPRASAEPLVGRLVFDSTREALPAGMRSASAMLRYAVYVAGNFCIDLHFQEEQESRTATIIGQMTDRQTPDRPMVGAPVLLVSKKRIIAHGVSNSSGEFCLDYQPEPKLRLLVGIDQNDKRIELPLGTFGGSRRDTSVRPRRK
jgi:hypothetical protein